MKRVAIRRKPRRRKGWNKFNARRTRCAQGYVHASGAEARYCDELHLRMRSIENRRAPTPERIIEIEHQRGVDLPYGVRYKPDFCLIFADGGKEYVEVKGVVTEAFRMKRKMFDATQPRRLRVVALRGRRWVSV